jgi:aminopeptidase 2
MKFGGELLGNMVGYYKSEGSTDEETGKKQM